MSIVDRVKRALAPLVHPVAAYDTSPPTLEDGDVRPIRMGADGGVLVEYPPGYTPPSGGGGGGDASAANQELALATLDQIHSTLQLAGTEATAQDILTAVSALGEGRSLDDLVNALTPLATEATQASIDGKTPALGQALAAGCVPVVLPASQASGELALRSQLPSALASDRLVVDGSGVTQPVSGTVAVNSLPGSPAQDRTTATSPSAVRLADGAGFYKSAMAGDNMGADLRVTGASVGAGNPVPVTPGTGATFQLAAGAAAVGSVFADLRVAGASVTNANPVPMQRASTSQTAVGAVVAAEKGTLRNSAGRLHRIHVEHATTGTVYVQLHDAASTGTIAAGTILGLGIELAGSGAERVIELPVPVAFATGISWALSTTKNTYTAAAGKSAYVFAQWE